MKISQTLVPAAGWAFLGAGWLSSPVAAQPRQAPPRQSIPRQRVEIPDSIVEQVLNHPELQWVFHPEVPERLPVVVSTHLINSRLSLRKFGQPVRFMADARLKTLKSKAFLRFIHFSIKGDVARVGVRYPDEGAGGSFGFQRQKIGFWKLTHARVWET